MTIKLKSKTYKRYTGKVYDLSVENKSSYNVEGIPVHNSGAGSLVCYLLGITQVDPIKHGLLFERFLSKKKMCLHPSTLVAVDHDQYKKISDIKIGDKILDEHFRPVKVVYTANQKHNQYCKIRLVDDSEFICSLNHRWIISEEYSDIQIEKETSKLITGDAFISLFNKKVFIKSIEYFQQDITLVDIGMETNHIFWVVDISGNDNSYMWYKSHNSLPDIDSDCADREEAIKILIEHFGEESVLPVSNYNQLQLKSLIKDLARLYQIPFEIINPITQKIEKETLDEDKKQDGFDRGVWFLSYESAVKNSPTFNQLLEDYPQLEASIKVLFKQIKSCFTKDTLILTDKGWKPFIEISDKHKIAYVDNVGDIQYSSDFFKIENGEKEVYKIEVESGKAIELTEDHLVQTDKGWKQVKDLTEEDSLIGWM